MFKSLPKEILIGLLATAIVGAFLLLKERYFTDDISVHYSVLHVKWPKNIKQNPDVSASSASVPQAMRLFVKNNMKQNADLVEIEILGVTSFAGFNVTWKPSEDGRVDEIKVQFDKAGGRLNFTNVRALSPDQQLGLYVWGEFYDATFAQVKTAEARVIAHEALLVVGIEKFFAYYWRLILLIAFGLLVTVVYAYHVRLKALEKKKT